jgi:hypothetical protein
MAVKIDIGDFFEFDVHGGYGHLHLTHFHPEWGHLVRIQGAIEKERPTNYEKIYNRTTRQITFYPLKLGIKDGLVRKVGNCEIPTFLKEFPQFRSNIRDKKGNYSTPWTIWDGTKSFTVKQLGEARYLPIREICTHSVIVERVEQKYRIYNDV